MNEPSPDYRSQLNSALVSADLHRIQSVIRQTLSTDRSLRQYRSIRNTIKSSDGPDLKLKPYRVALLSSFSIEFIHDALIVEGLAEGLDIQIYQPGFGQYSQEILDPSSGLYAFEAQIVVIAVEGSRWMSSVYNAYLDLNEVTPVIETALAEVTGLIKTFRSQSDAMVLIHSVLEHPWPRLGLLDAQLNDGQAACVARFNAGLSEFCREQIDCYLVDYGALVSRFGREQWFDARMAHYAQAPISQGLLGWLAKEYLKFIRAKVGHSRKCLVLDLDNTLWGGILGEDGIAGIRLGNTYPGSAFVEFQNTALALNNRGILLAIASKNNRSDVDEVFEKHSSMVLKPQHFAATQIHWEPKSESLEAIANSLNIGLEHIVFADDNPAECEQISQTLPMITVIPLPQRPEDYTKALLEDGYFDSLSFTKEDKDRTRLYAQRAQVEQLQSSSHSLENYWRKLEMTVSISPINEQTLVRATQLTSKTNQFNLTTIRYSNAEIKKRMGVRQWLSITVGVEDRFGDNGIVGVVMAKTEEDSLDIDTFLLSCRVIGRTVETSMLSYLWERASESGVAQLRGRVVRTAKNAPARDIYKKHGFRCVGGSEEDESLWVLDLVRDPVIKTPPWLTMVIS